MLGFLSRIIDWFGDQYQRYEVLRDFNSNAKVAFTNGIAPTLLFARTTKGDARYRHQFSKWGQGGYNIKALSGQKLNQSDLIDIAKVLLENKMLVRKLVTLGWDTLEIYDGSTKIGIKYSLIDFADIGGYLNG